MPDTRYFELHGKCAAGTLNPVERIELDALCAIKEHEFESPAAKEPSRGNNRDGQIR
jgi:hypothetical protein